MEYAIANFCCPITGRLMRDPVITRWGNNFERSAIMRSVESSGMDPVAQRSLRMFVCAVLEGHFELAEEMLLMGADIHHTPPGYVWADYALFEAAVTGKIEVVRWLLERGADPDVNLSKVLEVTRQRGLDDSYDLFANLVSV